MRQEKGGSRVSAYGHDSYARNTVAGYPFNGGAAPQRSRRGPLDPS